MWKRTLMPVACIGLSACAALHKADAPVTMRLSPTFAPATKIVPGAIAVAAVQARGFTATLRYAYIDAGQPGVIHQAASYFWEEAPSRVLERALVAGLRTRFSTVSGASVPLPADERVIAVLSRFEEADSGAAAHAVVAFDASIVKDGKLLRSGTFCASAAISAPSATVRAAAFETAIGAAVTAFVQTFAGDAPPTATC